jgi:hypothetical protein
MDQSEIDAIMGGGSGKGGKKSKGSASASTPASKSTAAPDPKPDVAPVSQPAPAPAPAPAPEAPKAAQPGLRKPEQPVRVIGELGAVTAVTERETNKVMDKLDQISQLLDQQRDIVTGIMGNESSQNPALQNSIKQIMTASTDIQNKIFEAMDLMQFQDISRQKLERIIHHLRQIHDYILDLLGTGFQPEKQAVPASISRSIANTGTTPDENKTHADSVVDEFIRTQKKG